MPITYGKKNNSAVGIGDTKVDLPGRHYRLPDIYKTDKHPLYNGAGQVYYFIHDGTLKGSRKIYELEVSEFRIPQGPHKEAVGMGAHIFASGHCCRDYMRLYQVIWNSFQAISYSAV